MWDFEKNKGAIKDLYSSVNTTNKIYRVLLITLSISCLILCIGLISLAQRQKIVPWVVQVDQHGFEVAIGPAEKTTAVDERVVLSRVARFVESLRTVVSDFNAQKSLVDWIYVSIPDGSAAVSTTNALYQANDPVKLAKKGVTISVTVQNIFPISKNTYRAEWIERTSQRGMPESESNWTGLFTIGVTPTVDLSSVIKNPLGIYITEYQITKNYN